MQVILSAEDAISSAIQIELSSDSCIKRHMRFPCTLPARILMFLISWCPELRRCTQPCRDNDHALDTDVLLNYAAAPSPARITTMLWRTTLFELRRCTRPCQDNDHALETETDVLLNYAAAPDPVRITTMLWTP
ncbi:hypothetical protein HDV64DRAFT_258475, partial [Trichoderma sp. TUCIM 5745]